MPGRAPERMCVACRERGTSDDLLRLVVHPTDGTLVLDVKGKLPGRGAWVHPMASCCQVLESKPNLLGRHLNAPVDTAALTARVRELILRGVTDGITMAAASGSVVGGHDRLISEISAGEITAVLFANDASSRTVASVRRAIDEAPIEITGIDSSFTRADFGRLTGRGERAALGVKSTKGAAFLRRQLRRLKNLG